MLVTQRFISLFVLTKETPMNWKYSENKIINNKKNCLLYLCSFVTATSTPTAQAPAPSSLRASGSADAVKVGGIYLM